MRWLISSCLALFLLALAAEASPSCRSGRCLLRPFAPRTVVVLQPVQIVEPTLAVKCDTTLTTAVVKRSERSVLVRRGPVRGTARWFHTHRPVRRALGAVFGFRRCR